MDIFEPKNWSFKDSNAIAYQEIVALRKEFTCRQNNISIPIVPRIQHSVKYQPLIKTINNAKNRGIHLYTTN